MKKRMLIVLSLVVLLLLLVVFGVVTNWFGVFQEYEDNNRNYSFLGTWEVNHSWWENGTKIDEWSYEMTFYANGTSKFELDNHSQISWEPYVFKNNRICYEDEETEICYTIEYHDSGNAMILTATITNQYGEITVVRDCARK